ncbi:unnamed protein product [Clonostachys rhizophaga]|uniref:Uncharacterized protein n=1 Tax=Clonostachys rhizophaga TaxID=160324 RepID=A0A9N9VMP6_9HYPO|nr:unnamed protein product [Clonostachys rhizophaga]
MPGITNNVIPEARPDSKILNGAEHGNGTSKENILNQGDISRHANGTAPAGISTTLPDKPLPRVADDLIDRSIDQPPRLRVAVIGAGLAGVQAGVLLPAKVPNIELVIFEKNAGVGGTWFENIYPGVRCDIPAHVYQSTYEPNVNWSEEFAQGAEIREYWEKVASKYGVYNYVKFGHKVEEISWDEDTSQWTVNLDITESGKKESQTFDFVITAIGRFNAWRLPDYPGIKDFKGILRHTSNWDKTFDPAGKRVAVIGNGASGIQLVANIQSRVARLDHYVRNKTWIAASFAGDDTSITPKLIPESKKEEFKDPEVYLKYRQELEGKYWRRFGGWYKGTAEVQETREKFIKIAKERLKNKPELVEHVIPEFSPNCRRLTPGPGYFEAIDSENVDYIQTKIKCFTETGIETEDGIHREVDAVFCATGANVDMVQQFPIRAYGHNLGELWHKDGAYGFPYSYLGIATPGFPNLLFTLGPYGGARSGTVTHGVEIQLTLFARILRKVSREGIKAIAPSPRATNDFAQYADSFFSKTVLSEDCSSWYNGGRPGERVHGVWPGSAAHKSIAYLDPRWEDWEYEYKTPENRFSFFFGNGFTAKETSQDESMTDYLQPGPQDLRKLHEGWWRIP